MRTSPRDKVAARDRVESDEPRGAAAESGGDRPELPFVLLRCVTWIDTAELPGDDNQEIRYWQRAGFTGSVALTSAGQDVTFSDLEAS